MLSSSFALQILEDPQLFSPATSSSKNANDNANANANANANSNINISDSSSSNSSSKKSQIEITLEYLDFCNLYPPRHFKTIRSHCMKFLFRYFEIHSDLRKLTGEVDSIADLYAICQVCIY